MQGKNFFLQLSIRTVAFLAFALGCGFTAARAQTISATQPRAQESSRSKYEITARAGAVNFISGTARWQKSDAGDWQPLTSKDELQTGDRVETGTDGFVEILLSPGAYLRMGANSAIEMTDASLDNLRVAVQKGSVIIEASGFAGADVATRINTPQTSIFITENGIYRINVISDATQVLVYKGEIRVGSETAETLVKKKKMLTIRGRGANETEELASINSKAEDQLDILSKERAKELAAMNKQLAANSSSTAFSSSLANYISSNWQWQLFNGLWAYNPFYSCYTFLPFDNFYSPYGFYYPSFVYIPTYYYYYPRPRLIVQPPNHPHPRYPLSGNQSARILRSPQASGHSFNARPQVMRSMPTYSAPMHSAPMHTMPMRTMPSMPMSSAAPSMPARSGRH